jgi:hypothetical protein
MSVNPETKFITFNVNTSQYQDLSGIFQPIFFGSPYPTLTGFKIPDGRDFNQIFASGNNLGYDVGYKLTNGSDLSQIFAKYDPLPFTISGTNSYSYVYSNGYYSVIIYNNNSAGGSSVTGTIQFNDTINNINTIIVGGGAGGGVTSSGGGTYGSFFGTGGGGGGVCILKSNAINGTSHSFSVGTGGQGTTESLNSNNGYNGNNSSVTINSSIYTASGGNYGLAGLNLSSYPGVGLSGGLGGSSTNFATNNLVIYSGNGGKGGNGGQLFGVPPPLNSYDGFLFATSGDPSDFNFSKNILNIPTTLNSYNIINGGGGGGASGPSSGQTPGGGGGGLGGQNGQGGSPSTTSIGNGNTPGGGGGGSNSYSIASGNGGNGIVAYYFQYPNITNNYFGSYTGLYNMIYDGNYCYINFFTSGTLTLLSQINNAIIICVGGGGGGGGAMETSPPGGSVSAAGAGGGGGGAGVITSVTLSATTYNITVGSGGIGGARPGNTSLTPGQYVFGTAGSNSSFGTLISATGGGGGQVIIGGGYASPGAGGTVSVAPPYSLYCGGNGGIGGSGLFDVNYFAPAGNNSAIYNFTAQGSNGFMMPNGKYIYFSGGGGGGKDGSSSYGTGGYSGMGAGGGQGTIGYYNSSAWTQEVSWPNVTVFGSPLPTPGGLPLPLFSLNDCSGKNAVLYGAGGGGCGGETGFPGGNGGTGIVMLIFQYQ